MKAITVSILNEYVQSLLERDPALKSVSVQGEISGFKLHSSGHMYFTLKDSGAVIRCAMFRQNNASLRFRPADGMSVVATGSVSLYPRDGQYQLYVNRMEHDGLGALYAAYEKLKASLEREGLFNTLYKKPIPAFVRKIAVVTSPTGAVIRDIIRVAKRRFPGISILLYPVNVQGDGAAAEIAAAIDKLNNREDIDAMIVGRGGGSIEDLWAFNEEVTVRAIFHSRIPVVSAVGHETDFTIADFVADVRAATPSAAAELVVPDIRYLQSKVQEELHNLTLGWEYVYSNALQKLHRLENSRFMKQPQLIMADHFQRVDYASFRLKSGTQNYINDAGKSLSLLAGKLHSLSPLAVLGRGYALLSDEQGYIASTKRLVEGQQIKIQLQDGSASAQILHTEEQA